MQQPQLSILVCSLESRAGLLGALLRHLTQQIHPHGQEAEVLVDVDNGEKSIGAKRNDLLSRANGRYVAFVDDDDWVPEYYVSDILAALHDNPDVDCLGFRGVVAVDGGQPSEFIHSLECKDWYVREGVYYRTPNHLNPVRREIARDAGFPGISHGEDHDYSRGVQNRAKSEVMLPRGMYHYSARTDKTTVPGSPDGRAIPQFVPPASLPGKPGGPLPHPVPYSGPPVAPITRGAVPVVEGPFPPTTVTTPSSAPSQWQVPAPVPTYHQPRVRNPDGTLRPPAVAPQPEAVDAPAGPPRPAATSPPSPAFPIASEQPCPVNPTGGVWPPPLPTKATPSLALNPQAAIARQLNTPSGRRRRKGRG